MSSKKIGFWAVFALVIGSQIGSGAFILPSALAPFGGYALAGWAISGIAAISIAIIFAALCARFPETGGPHIYVMKVFGNTVGFFIGWGYWVISWVSTATVVIACIGYLSPIIGPKSQFLYLSLQIFLLLFITFLNFRGLAAASAIEFILTILKFIPLIILPIASIYLFDKNNFVLSPTTSEISLFQILGKVTLLTFWGFIGVESATTPAGSVENPTTTIPKAIILGTICVALMYFFNSAAILGVINGDILAQSKAPYADAAQIIFSGNWGVIVSIITSIVCIGTLNAWVLSSGQILLGLAEKDLMPKIFARKNKAGAPALAIITSVLGIIPLLIFTTNASYSAQIANIIDISVIAFLFVYLTCALALLKILMQSSSINYFVLAATFLAIIICSFIIYETPVSTLLIASSFILSGLPLYFIRRHNINNASENIPINL